MGGRICFLYIIPLLYSAAFRRVILEPGEFNKFAFLLASFRRLHRYAAVKQ